MLISLSYQMLETYKIVCNIMESIDSWSICLDILIHYYGLSEWHEF